jgi:hypothetical protein
MTLKFQETYKTDEEASQINSRAKGVTAICHSIEICYNYSQIHFNIATKQQSCLCMHEDHVNTYNWPLRLLKGFKLLGNQLGEVLTWQQRLISLVMHFPILNCP